jgi:DNA ligase (NAD+)
MESGEDYANPRNLASGSLTLKDADEVRQRHIQWIPFTLVYTDADIDSWGQRMAWLDQQGFTTVERQFLERPSETAVEQGIAAFTQKVVSRQNPFPVDGLVICYDDTVYAQTGSVTGHHATRAGLAFKWQDETAETTLSEIEWSCAASTISPVAIFQPVELEGTTVKRASLCNISECERLGIGGPGTRLSVIKANKIIPKVIAVK